jgi:hypothetical protein
LELLYQLAEGIQTALQEGAGISSKLPRERPQL